MLIMLAESRHRRSNYRVIRRMRVETLHLVFSSSGRLMRILGSIVAPSTMLMSSCYSKITGSGRITPYIVRDQLVWDKAILLQKLAHEFQRGTLVPPALDQHIKHFALGIHGAPKIDHAASDFQIDLVKMPGGVGLGSTFAQVRRDHGPEMIHPAIPPMEREMKPLYCRLPGGSWR